MATCRSCGADVQWALTEKEKPMPVDPEPVDDGNLELYRDNEGEQRVRVLVDGESLSLPGLEPPARYRSHFASCPNADKHRRRP